MTMTRDDARLMDALMEDNVNQDAVYEACNEAIQSLKEAGYRCAQDDRRAALDAAIYRYLLACKED